MQIKQHDFEKFDWIFGMDLDNIEQLNNIKPLECHAKIELLGNYHPNGQKIIRDPYYVCYSYIYIIYSLRINKYVYVIRILFLLFSYRIKTVRDFR